VRPRAFALARRPERSFAATLGMLLLLREGGRERPRRDGCLARDAGLIPRLCGVDRTGVCWLLRRR
jgi:hypothetical protein